MKIPIYQIDAFTDKAFGGNPAAVCPLQYWLDDDILQKIAMENNLSETAFFVNKGDCIELRWFTPAVEVDLCGHATLAAAYVIFNYIDLLTSEICFESISGQLRVTKNKDLLTLNFPARKPVPVPENNLLINALGAEPKEILNSRDYFAVFEKEQDIIDLDPDFKLLAEIDCLGICVTAPGNNSDFVSRFFAPQAGINEDPVTGSAHTSLIPYWSEKLNKKKLHAFQISKRRGELFCEDAGERVNISGKAVKFMEGFIEI